MNQHWGPVFVTFDRCVRLSSFVMLICQDHKQMGSPINMRIRLSATTQITGNTSACGTNLSGPWAPVGDEATVSVTP